MDLHYPPSAIPSLVALAALLLIFAITGVKRGWIGQVAILGVTMAVWGVSTVRANSFVNFANSTYKGILFVVSCAIEEDPFACLETSGIMQRILVDPKEPDQIRLFYLVLLVFTLLVTYVLVMRFGREPNSTFHRVIGAATGALNGLILGYLLLPLATQQFPIALPAVSLGHEESSSQTAGHATGSAADWGRAVPLVFLILFVLFVVVAVRLIRPTSTDR